MTRCLLWEIRWIAISLTIDFSGRGHPHRARLITCKHEQQRIRNFPTALASDADRVPPLQIGLLGIAIEACSLPSSSMTQAKKSQKWPRHHLFCLVSDRQYSTTRSSRARSSASTSSYGTYTLRLMVITSSRALCASDPRSMEGFWLRLKDPLPPLLLFLPCCNSDPGDDEFYLPVQSTTTSPKLRRFCLGLMLHTLLNRFRNDLSFSRLLSIWMLLSFCRAMEMRAL